MPVGSSQCAWPARVAICSAWPVSVSCRLATCEDIAAETSSWQDKLAKIAQGHLRPYVSSANRSSEGGHLWRPAGPKCLFMGTFHLKLVHIRLTCFSECASCILNLDLIQCTCLSQHDWFSLLYVCQSVMWLWMCDEPRTPSSDRHPDILHIVNELKLIWNRLE